MNWRIVGGVVGGLGLCALGAWALSRHEGQLGDDRAIAQKSLREEEKAIRDYGHRLRQAKSPRLKEAIAHARREERQHAAAFRRLR